VLTRSTTAALGLLAAAAAAAAAAGCGSLSAGTYQDALGRWRMGDNRGVVRVAREQYQRFRDDNGLAQAAVEAAAAAAWTQLEEEPVVARGDAPAEMPGVEDSLEASSSFLVREVQADLLSDRVTPAIRGCLTVRDLGLRSLAAGVLAVIYRRDPYAADGGVLAGASPALRSVAAKWTALGALEAIAAGRPARPAALPPAPLARPR
jgi:hypothetical protein